MGASELPYPRELLQEWALSFLRQNSEWKAKGPITIRLYDGSESGMEIGFDDDGDAKYFPLPPVPQKFAAEWHRERLLAQIPSEFLAVPTDGPRTPPEAAPGLLRLVVRLLPGSERGEWLEEQRGYLADLPSRRARWKWIASAVVGMPQLAHTARTGHEKEPA